MVAAAVWRMRPSITSPSVKFPDAGLGGGAHQAFLEAAAEFEGAAEEEIAGDQRRREAVTGEGRGLAAAQQSAVDDVVVKQRCRVNQFERDRRVDCVRDFLVDAAACAIDQQDEERALAFAAAIDEVMADLADEGLVGIEQVREFFFGRE